MINLGQGSRTAGIVPTVVCLAGFLVETASDCRRMLAAEADRPSESGHDLQRANDWLNTLLTNSVLFRAEDIEQIRRQVSQMSPVELRSWLHQTEPIRARLNGSTWLKTRAFLKDFLAKQAIYSSEEIDEFRSRAARMTAEELMDLLDRLERTHAGITATHYVDVTQRQRDLIRQEQVVEAEANRQQAALDLRDRYFAGQAKANAARPGGRGRPPHFGLAPPRPIRPKSTYKPPPPLITSREVARETVRRAVLGRYRCDW